MPHNLLWVDTETSGLLPHTHEITQIACILTDLTARTVLGGFTAWMNLEHPERADPRSLALNGYPEHGWAEPQSRARVAASAASLSKGAILAGHNVAFDEAFLRSLLYEHDFESEWDYHRLDTASLVYPWFAAGRVRSLSLRDVAPFFGVPHQNNHDAADDAEAARRVYLAIAERMGSAVSL